jgi:saccharopine dehydrogenase-like NADP-dependent oxidoreductase
MRYDFVVVGATGMQGRIVTRDLIENGYTVLMCGRDKSMIEHLLKRYPKKTSFEYLDMKDKAKAIRTIKNSGAKIAINCVEGDWDLKALEYFIEAGINSIDLGSDIPMTRKQLALDKELKRKELIHITGCGSVP